MAKSIKFKNDTYLDSSSVIHNRNSIANMITSFYGGDIGGIPIKKRILNCNFNELWRQGTGMFIAYATIQNAPYGNGTNNVHFYVLQFVYNTGYNLQIAVPLHGETQFMYMRSMINGIWKPWKRIEFKTW